MDDGARNDGRGNNGRMGVEGADAGGTGVGGTGVGGGNGEGVDIEILVVPDCPNTGPAAELLRQVLDGMGLRDTGFSTRVIADRAEAEAVAFTGSPTFLIDGRDPFAEPGHAPGLACRLYRDPDGSGPSGLPGADRLRRALAQSRAGQRGRDRDEGRDHGRGQDRGLRA